MPSPTTPILDSFTRADENPLTATNWATSVGTGCKIVSNKCVQVTAAGYDASTWKTPQGANAEVYCQIGTVPAASTYIDLYWRNQTQGDFLGSHMHLTINNTTDTAWNLNLWGYDGAVDRFLQSVELGTPFVVNDQVWAKSIGNVHEIYYNGTLKFSFTDTNNYAPDGTYFAILFAANSAAGIKNFGGGTLPAVVLYSARRMVGMIHTVG